MAGPAFTEPLGARAALGLIVLQVDETIEHEFRRLIPATVALFVNRIPSGADLTPETIAGMKAALPAAASLFPPARPLDAVGYACTSGATLIGPDRVAALVSGAARAAAVTDPLTALRAALEALGIRRIALVSPYIPAVTGPMVEALGAGGVTVAAEHAFGIAEEARVARIAPGSVAEAARSVADAAEAVFLSCTNLQTLDLLGPLEAELDKPVLASNQVLAWHMARLAGIGLARPGRLFKL